MRILALKILIGAFLILAPFHILAQDDTTVDSIYTNKELKRTQRTAARKSFKKQFMIGMGATYAKLNSSVRFEGPNGIFSTQINMERHLGFEDLKMIYSGSFIFRITPRSGLYALYYQLHREREFYLERDLTFLNDTIQTGIQAGGYFKTNVLSFGYLFTVLEDKKSFLGVYLNMYVIKIAAGVYSQTLNIQQEVGMYAPMPNIGFLARFNLTKWFTLTGGAGMFFINDGGQNGTFHDVHASVIFKPAKWVGLSLGYYVFNVNADVPVGPLTAYFKYNFKGPNVGLHFNF